MFESADHLWVVHISNNKHLAERAQGEGFICIGWTRIGDLTPYDTPESLRTAYERAFPGKSAASVSSSYGQVYRFAHQMKVGDPVVYPIKASRDVLIGRIAGAYQWSADPELRAGDYCNIRAVEWLAKVPRVRFSQGALRSFGSFSSVSTADDHLNEVRAVLAGESGSRPEVPVAVADEDEAKESENDAEMAAEEVIQRTRTISSADGAEPHRSSRKLSPRSSVHWGTPRRRSRGRTIWASTSSRTRTRSASCRPL